MGNSGQRASERSEFCKLLVLGRFSGCSGKALCALFLHGTVVPLPNASVAQLVEQLTLNQLVLGSNPSRGTP